MDIYDRLHHLERQAGMDAIQCARVLFDGDREAASANLQKKIGEVGSIMAEIDDETSEEYDMCLRLVTKFNAAYSIRCYSDIFDCKPHPNLSYRDQAMYFELDATGKPNDTERTIYYILELCS